MPFARKMKINPVFLFPLRWREVKYDDEYVADDIREDTIHKEKRSIERWYDWWSCSVFNGVPRVSDENRRGDSAWMGTRGGARHVGDAVPGDAATRHEGFRVRRASAHWTRRGRWSHSCPCPRAGRSPRRVCRDRPLSSSPPRCPRRCPSPPRSSVSSGTRSPVHTSQEISQIVSSSSSLYFLFVFVNESHEICSWKVIGNYVLFFVIILMNMKKVNNPKE